MPLEPSSQAGDRRCAEPRRRDERVCRHQRDRRRLAGADDRPEALVVDPGDLLERGRPAEDPLQVGSRTRAARRDPPGRPAKSSPPLTKVGLPSAARAKAQSSSRQAPLVTVKRHGASTPGCVSAHTRPGISTARSRQPPSSGCVTSRRPPAPAAASSADASPDLGPVADRLRRDLAAPVEVAGVQGELELGRAWDARAGRRRRRRRRRLPPTGRPATRRSPGTRRCPGVLDLEAGASPGAPARLAPALAAT